MSVTQSPTSWWGGPPLLRDPFVWIGLVVWILAALPSLAPVLPEDLAYAWADAYSDAPSFVLFLIATLVAARQAVAGRERLLWQLFAGMALAWLSVRLLLLVFPYEHWGIGADLTSDLAYLTGYFLAALALERPPYGEEAKRSRAAHQRVESLGTLIFAFGLLTYFVLAPSIFTPDVYDSWVSSLFLYAVLDLYLLVRFVALLRADPAPEWRPALIWFAVSFAFWFVGDTVEGLMYLGTIPLVWAGTPWDLLWLAPAFTVLLAVRSRSVAA